MVDGLGGNALDGCGGCNQSAALSASKLYCQSELFPEILVCLL